MNKYWHMVIVGALLEVIWVTGLAHANSILTWTVTIVSVILSYALFTVAAKGLPMGTGYAIWTGIGTVGTVIAGIVFYQDKITFLRIFLIVISVIGLKLVENM